ncbi:MAG: hypothetical protein OER85_10675 [Gammaproteobacteria bacterium]|nr:hypothetical protein [Gammaproteobacteria bacterium]
MNKRVTFLVLVALALSFSGNASAAPAGENHVLNDKYAIWLGGFFPELSSKIQINGDIIGDGDIIDFEDTLGLEDSKTVIWGGARWRISRRNSLEFEFADLNRDGSISGITEELQIGDSLVQAGARIDSRFDVTLGRLTYGFSLLRDEKMDIQLKAGLHIADLSVGLQLTGAVCVDGEPPPCFIEFETPQVESEDVTAPLPHFGGSFSYAFTPNISARFQVIGFAIELDSLDGSLVEVDADVVWTPWEHFGFGAGLRYFNVDVESKGSDLNGQFDYEYYGPAIYGYFTF